VCVLLCVYLCLYVCASKSVRMCTRLYVCCNPFICATWLTSICDMTHHTCGTEFHTRVHMCDTIHSFIHVACLRVVPSKIPHLERKRDQYHDSWVCLSETKLQNLDICGTSENSPVEALGLWHLWHFYVLGDILGFAKKTNENTYRVTKT